MTNSTYSTCSVRLLPIAIVLQYVPAPVGGGRTGYHRHSAATNEAARAKRTAPRRRNGPLLPSRIKEKTTRKTRSNRVAIPKRERVVITDQALVLRRRLAVEVMTKRRQLAAIAARTIAKEASAWPEQLSPVAQRQLYEQYRVATSYERLQQLVCAICGSEWQSLPGGQHLSYGNGLHPQLVDILLARGRGEPPHDERLYGDPILDELDIVIERRGIDHKNKTIYACHECAPVLANGRLPKHSYANGLWLEAQPAVLAA